MSCNNVMQVAVPGDEKGAQHVAKVASVVDWLHGLGLGKYEDVFVLEEVVNYNV